MNRMFCESDNGYWIRCEEDLGMRGTGIADRISGYQHHQSVGIPKEWLKDNCCRSPISSTERMLAKIIRGLHPFALGTPICRRKTYSRVSGKYGDLLIGVMAKSGRWSAAVELLAEARKDGLEPNTFCYSAAVSACAKGRNWKLALSLIAEMRREGLELDLVAYGSAMSAMAKVGHWQLALAFLARMKSDGLKPNVVCYGAAVDACAKGGQWEKAIELLDDMRADDVIPDKICYNTAVHACAQRGQWELAVEIANRMRNAPSKMLRPDSFTWNSVLHAVGSSGDWQRVLIVLEDMKGDGIRPDLVSYNTVMRACNKAGQYQHCLSAFEEMVSEGITPDQESIAAAAEAHAEDRSIPSEHAADAVLHLLEFARSKGLRPEARAVAASMAACVGGGHWHQAVPAIEKLVKARNGHTWDEVMHFLENARVECRRRGESVGTGGAQAIALSEGRLHERRALSDPKRKDQNAIEWPHRGNVISEDQFLDLAGMKGRGSEQSAIVDVKESPVNHVSPKSDARAPCATKQQTDRGYIPEEDRHETLTPAPYRHIEQRPPVGGSRGSLGDTSPTRRGTGAIGASKLLGSEWVPTLAHAVIATAAFVSVIAA